MTAAAATQPRRKQPLFIYPALPKYELYFYVAVIAGIFLYAWVSIVIASNNYASRFQHRTDNVKVFPLIGPRFQDTKNWEWRHWSPFGFCVIPYYMCHSLFFNIATNFLTSSIISYISIIYSVAYCCYLFTPWLVFLSITQGTLIFAVSHFTKRQLGVWLGSIPILYYTMNWATSLTNDPFAVLLFVAYTLLSYISFNLETMRGEVRTEDDTLLKTYIRMLFYTFYPPYLVSLIVPYRDFERQIAERTGRTRDWREILFFTARILFWWTFVEHCLYFAYHESMLTDPDFARYMPKDQFVSAGMAMGQFFHLKYMVIFGLPAIFARLDNMQPAKGPICIMRVALYSKIWRCFDRGLYEFFKRYIFIPICEPTFSLGRKIFGVMISYSFVLLWHGFHYHNIVWIGLNIAELYVEYTAKAIYSIESVRMLREKKISDVAFRRILAWLQIVPFVFGLYSNFYFLGGNRVGRMFVERIWNEETLTLQYPAILLICMAYCYTHVTMEAERYLYARDKKHQD